MKRKWTPEETERAMTLRREGMSYAAIGSVMGRSEAGVRDRVLKQNPYCPSRPGTETPLGWQREDHAWRDDARQGSAALLQALLRMAA